ncbi:MAG TPA: glycerophosphodiester phosphodiesterase, partial [Gemmatimonadaceae bacterium]|nr:glycerophosphodiester phosphodiesterase [Gemmatimonadaceae bacterium]
MTASSGIGRNVERIGHRGAPRRYLENTLPAFTEAVRLGADAVELDVHVTADGQVVVHHDPALSRRVTPAAMA